MSPSLKTLLFFALAHFAGGVESFRFEVKTIAEDFARPMGMDLGPDGSIYLIELQGRVSRIHPVTGDRTSLAEIKVFGEQENGLLGIALDPNFEKNNQIWQKFYKIYSKYCHVSVA